MNLMTNRLRVHEPDECPESYPEGCNGVAEWVPDPYLEDVHQITEYDWFCPGKYESHCMEI